MGAGMLGMHQTKDGWPLAADIAVLSLVGLDFVMFGGHLYNALDLFGINGNTLMSPQTLLCFFCLTFALVCRRARHGQLLAVLINHGIGSRIVRMVLPAALFTPYAILGLVAYATQSHTLSAPYARAIAAAASAFLILCLITWMGRRINAMERELRDLSLTDELTSVYNRRGFYFLGQQILRDDARRKFGVSLLFFDLNGLKAVNDLMGHEAGSDMIEAFAAILRKTFRSGDVVSRVGGDEFAVLTVGDEGMKLPEILSRLEQNTQIFNNENSKDFSLSFSLGYTHAKTDGTETLDDMMARADALMYADKVRRKTNRSATSA
jgi:diguanylate cyclase (GGDEF)-like protein